MGPSTRPISFISFDAKNHIVASSTYSHVSVWDIDMLTLSKDVSSTAIPTPIMELEKSRTFTHNSNDAPSQIHTVLHETSTGTLLTAINAPLPDGLALWSLQYPDVSLLRFKPGADKTSTIASVTKVVWDRIFMAPASTTTASTTTNNSFSILVSGHSDSSCLLWNIPESALIPPKTGIISTISIQPIRKIQVTVSSPLSTLSLDPFKLLVSTTDGLIKAYDISTGLAIKTVSVRRSGEVGGFGEVHDRRFVTCVWPGEWNLIVATAGGHVRNWDFAPIAGDGVGYMKLRGKKNRVGKGRFSSTTGTPVGGVVAGVAGSSRSSTTTKAFNGKAQLIQDVKTETMATNLELKLEKEHEQRRLKLFAKMNGVPTPPNFGVVGMGRTIVGMGGTGASLSKSSPPTTTPGGMSEQEMIDYAIMLSREEQNDPFSLGDSATYFTPPPKASAPILDENSVFSPFLSGPSTATSSSLPKHISTKPPPAPSTLGDNIAPTVSKSPTNPWGTGKSFASVAAAAVGVPSASSSNSSIPTTPLAHKSNSSLLTFSESPVARASPSNPFIRSSPQCRFPMAWYDDDDDWEDEAGFYKLGTNDGNLYTPSKRRSSLSISLSGVLPPSVEDNEAVVGEMEPGEWEDSNATRSVEINTQQAKKDGSLSSSASSVEKRKFLLGGSTSGAATSWGDVGAIHMRRSPRLGPMGSHVSPQLRPATTISPSLAPTTQFSGVGVQVAPRATFDDEDEELMFVLALSLSEHQK
ncbi:UNVERIFIED_CONTAM: hypothetical protein HDU68_010487 [Siphonaria sp. JEL0065]|nr:hypothetical protein HDU68_010487 [Siphonaria sp. JEL0065]